MSKVRKSRTRTQAGSDGWWEIPSPPQWIAERPHGSRARRKRTKRAFPLRVLRTLAVPVLALVVGCRDRVPKRVYTALVVGAVGISIVGWSLGVILLNNIVIQRSAELGSLEKERRILRTENALLSAEAARLSAPPRVIARARVRLGMIENKTMPRFLYLDPANRPAAIQQASAVQTAAAKAAASGSTLPDAATGTSPKPGVPAQ